MKKSIKVKSLADKYNGATGTLVVEALKKLNINDIPISGAVPAEQVERVEAYLVELFGQPKSRKKTESKADKKMPVKAEAKNAVKKTAEKKSKDISAAAATPTKNKAVHASEVKTSGKTSTVNHASEAKTKTAHVSEVKTSGKTSAVNHAPEVKTKPAHASEVKTSGKTSAVNHAPEAKTKAVDASEAKTSGNTHDMNQNSANAKPIHASNTKPVSKPVVKNVMPLVDDDDDEIPVVPAKLAKPLLETKFEKIPRHNKPSQGRAFPEKIYHKTSQSTAPPVTTALKEEIVLNPPVTVKIFAEASGKKPNEVITDLIGLGVFASINQLIPEDAINKLCAKYGIKAKIEHRAKVKKTGSAPPVKVEFVDRPEDIKQRPPVVTFLGHVDHGKTSLLDKVRNTSIVDGEAGHITQHIGASQVEFHGQQITFIDTPGHEAFTQMRARGANLTDIAVLVVAADDGFMMQTVEALNHARAAGVPIIVAINKIDLAAADPGKILLQMQQNNLTSEEWGGDVGVVKVSAKTGEGIPDLLERILLEAEMLELRANPKRPAEATVLEAQMEHGFGATANILVTNGTLKVGDAIVCGEYYGRVKMLINAYNQRVQSAGPSTSVKLVGLSGVPQAGALLEIKSNEKEARIEAEARAETKRQEQLAQAVPVTMEDMLTKMDSENKKSLNMIIKSDVRGTAEAIEESLTKINSEKISVNVIMSGVGAITENDIMLAAASGAMVVGFHVRVNPGVNEIAKKNGVEIRLYTIIYELLEDITDTMTGKLQPDKREKDLGQARILQIFELTKGPKICGCKVEKGLVKVGAKARVFRDGELIFNGDVASLRRFQDDVKEVKAGFECGIRLNNFADFLEGDVIELYEIELTKATL